MFLCIELYSVCVCGTLAVVIAVEFNRFTAHLHFVLLIKFPTSLCSLQSSWHHSGVANTASAPIVVVAGCVGS